MEYRRSGRAATTRGLIGAVASLLAAAVVSVCSLLGAPRANARVLHTVLQDDGLALFSPSWLPRFVARLHWLGVDELRISAEWKLEAPDPDSPTPPAGFQFANPAAYNSPGMALLDRAVRAASAAGLHVIIDPAFSAPRWATSGDPGAGAEADRWYRTNINVDLLAAWEAMLARRYSGTFTPPGGHAPLPFVGTFTLWNEPNGPGFLQPQWRGGVAASADWYRSLVDLAYPAIKSVSPASTVLIGNTSNTGSDTPTAADGVPPMAFIRRLACVDVDLRPVHDGACAKFHQVPADGYAHHPYERKAPPWTPSGPSQPGLAQMGDLPALQALLDRLVAMHRLARGARNLWLTEQGYESNAELPDRPWTEAQQAELNAASEYLAWRDPHIASISQFLLRDTLAYETFALRRSTGRFSAQLPGTWTTGLMREDMTPKPALAMFRAPVVVRTLRRASGAQLLEVWGRARPATAPAQVRIQLQTLAGFRVIGGAITDQNGIFDTEVLVPPAASPQLRFQWLTPGGAWQTSPAVDPLPIPGPS